MATDKNKTFKFFKDSGIQFFSISSAVYSHKQKFHEEIEEDYALFTKKWFPLSLDGCRNILMFRFLSTGDSGDIMFSIDTTSTTRNLPLNIHTFFYLRTSIHSYCHCK